MTATVEPIAVIQRSLPGINGSGSRLFYVCPVCGHVLRRTTWINRHIRLKHGATT